MNFGYGEYTVGTQLKLNGGDYGYPDYYQYARAVRGGQSVSLGNAIGSFDALNSGLMDAASTAASSYTDNGDGTVTDNYTGLTWQQSSSSGKIWEQALAYCEGLNICKPERTQ